MTPIFHQVCLSDFVLDRCIAYIYGTDYPVNQFAPTDFLYSTSGQFQLLSSLCQLSQETVLDSHIDLSERDFINVEVLSDDSVFERINTVVYEFKETTPKPFLNILSMIRETTGTNKIMTILSTSWVIDTPPVIYDFSTAHTLPLLYQGYNCASSSKCVQPSRSMYAGCYLLEALLQSTFECLYNQQCINLSHEY
jgi:hypothetical protein